MYTHVQIPYTGLFNFPDLFPYLGLYSYLGFLQLFLQDLILCLLYLILFSYIVLSTFTAMCIYPVKNSKRKSVYIYFNQ